MADITSVDLARLAGDNLEQAGPDATSQQLAEVVPRLVPSPFGWSGWVPHSAQHPDVLGQAVAPVLHAGAGQLRLRQRGITVTMRQRP